MFGVHTARRAVERLLKPYKALREEEEARRQHLESELAGFHALYAELLAEQIELRQRFSVKEEDALADARLQAHMARAELEEQLELDVVDLELWEARQWAA